MKKEDIHQLLKESRVNTSDHFTNKLLEKIELEPKVVRVSIWHKLSLWLGIAGLMGTSYFMIKLPRVKILNAPIDLPPFLFQVMTILFVLWAFNFYLSLMEHNNQSEENL